MVISFGDPLVAIVMVAIGIAVAWFVVYFATGAAIRDELAGTLTSVALALETGGDGEELWVTNIGALPIFKVTAVPYPPRIGEVPTLADITTLAPRETARVRLAPGALVPSTSTPRASRLMVDWRVGNPAGPARSSLVELVRQPADPAT